MGDLTIDREEPRVMVAGSPTGGGVEDDHADWNKEKQIGDFDVAIFDLHKLEEKAHEYDHPQFDTERAVTFPSDETIRKHLEAGNNIVVRLPTNQEAVANNSTHGPLEYDLLNWLPFCVSLADESGEKVVKPDESNEALRQNWRRYFGGFEERGIDPISGWENAIESISPVNADQLEYSDPTPPEPDDDGIVRKSSTPRLPQPDEPPQPTIKAIRFDNLKRLIAARIEMTYPNNDLRVDLPTEGSVYLLPPTTDLSHSEFVGRYLWAKHRLVTGPTPPRWLNDHPIPGEQELKRRADELMSELEELEEEILAARDARTQLLWGWGDELEEVVRGTFEELGFEVDGEVPGSRDGAIHTENRVFVLEVT